MMPLGWLELTRASNLPTVWSNVLVGIAIGMASGGQPARATVPLLLVAISLIYVAGMVLNDLLDEAVDVRERPGRPLPSGRVARGAAWGFVAGAMTLGMVALGQTTWPAARLGVLLVAMVVAYNALHRATVLSLPVMGACRSLVYLACAAAVAWPLDWRLAWPLAALIGVCVTALSAVARSEAKHPKRIGVVLVMLGGISILDAGVLAWLQQWTWAAAAAGCYALTRLGHKRIMGT